ncbi:SDR family oxidoreductase [Kitasatospora sp. NPDC059795]|uniref:SDR family oxidoreductase n=1 Tax=Kitasatospora sp. NPDC059795 TaxID=3346949 RepID=UPI00365283B9
MRILVLGAVGLLGTALSATASPDTDLVGLAHHDCDVTDFEQVAAATAAHRPQVLINAAAIPHTRACEVDPVRARAVNIAGARNCAQAANRYRALLVQISGNIVFAPAEHPRAEDEYPDNTDGVLGQSKAAADSAAVAADRLLLVRTACLFGNHADGTPGGLIGRILATPDGATLRMTRTATNAAHTQDVATAIHRLASELHTGTYHLVNPRPTTPYELARAVAARTGRIWNIEPTDLGTPRLLATGSATAAGIELRPLPIALDAYFAAMAAG